MIKRLGVLLLFALGIMVTNAHAQATSAALDGQVRDASGGVIVGATLQITNDATGATITRQTDGQGIYSFPNLPAGSYHLIVSKEGFRTLAYQNIVLNLQDVKAITITLPVGSVVDTVTVEGGTSLVDTESAAVSTVVDSTVLRNMPLNGRSFQDLILLTPGVVTNSPQGGGTVGQTGEFSVNGQRTESNYYMVDGVSANVGTSSGLYTMGFSGPSGSVAGSTSLGTTQALVSVDDLQEFRVQSSTYSAEYGRSPGGQIAFETKSGTNQWHGSAYDYVRNGFFDANDWFNNYYALEAPPLRQNDFGGTFGGPVEIPKLYSGKDRTFFFVSYEGLRLDAPQAATPIPVPDASLRASAPAPLNRVLQAFPVPNGKNFGDGIAEFIHNWSNPNSIDSTSIRFDHVFNERLRLFLRFSDTASTSVNHGVTSLGFVPSVNQDSPYTNRSYTGAASSVLTARLSNEFRVNYTSNELNFRQSLDGFGGATPVDLAQFPPIPAGASVALYLCYDGCSALQQIQAPAAQRQWNLVDTSNFTAGRHQFKFGGDYRRLAPFATQTPITVNYFFFSESSVMRNHAFGAVGGLAPAYPLYKNFSAFVQDEWKVTRRLNLSLGLRWELNPAPGVTKGLMPYTVQGSGPDDWSFAPQGTPLWQTTWFNFAPRIGGSYLLRGVPGWETVVRGGGGLFFDTAQQLGSFGFFGPGFSSLGTVSGPFPSLPSTGVPPIANPPQLPFLGPVYGFPKHLQLPYTLQWNAAFEQGLGTGQALTVSYVGSHAGRLLQTNQLSSSVNQTASTFVFISNGLTSDYDSLQTQFRRRLSRGLTALASYTWSHCMDYGSANYTLGYQRGNCDFDVRHNFSGAFSYDLPNRGTNGFASAVFHSWGIDGRLTARTAFPLGLNGAATVDPATGRQTSTGLDRLSGQAVYLYGAQCNQVYASVLLPGQGCPGGRAVNTCAFVVHGGTPGPPCFPAGTTLPSDLGLVPRNFARGFGAWQTDLAVRREFPIYEKLRVQFRAETFNIFNHPNFGTINTAFGSPLFGLASASLASSLGVLNPLYQQGGPRSMQFAMRVTF